MFVFFLGISLLCCSGESTAKRLIEPPTEEDFKVEVDGKSITVQQARVSKYPANQNYAGYERPLSQTEIAYFASFDYEVGKTIKDNGKGY